MPSRPANGARMIFWSTTACCSATWAWPFFQRGDVAVERGLADGLRLELFAIAIIGDLRKLGRGLQ